MVRLPAKDVTLGAPRPDHGRDRGVAGASGRPLGVGGPQLGVDGLRRWRPCCPQKVAQVTARRVLRASRASTSVQVRRSLKGSTGA